MSKGFNYLKTLNALDLNASEVTNMASMFQGCSSLTTIAVCGWNMDSMANVSYAALPPWRWPRRS